MNKVLVGVISSLATLGIVGGAGAIALSSPNVKENLNVSFGQSDLMGNNISENNKKLQQLSNELAEKNMLLAEEQDKVFNLTNQVDKLNEDKIQCKIQIANLKGDNANLTKDVETLNRNLTTANNKVTTLENRVSNYQTQITNLRNTNTRLNENLTTYRNENNDLKVQLSDAIQDYNMMQEERDILAQDIERYFEQVQELDARIIEKDDEIIELNNQIMSKQMTIYDLQSDIESNNIRIANLQNELTLAESERSELISEIENLTSQVNILNDEITNNTSTINDLSLQLADIRIQLSDKEDELVICQENIIELNATIQSLQTSMIELSAKIDYYEHVLENYVIVNYVVSSESNYVVQDKNSSVNFENPIKSGYIFTGWSLTENGAVIDENTIFVEDTTLFAVFMKEPVANDFYKKRKLPNGDWVYSDSNGSSSYAGVWYQKASESTIKQIYPDGYLWEVKEVIDNNRVVVSTNSNGSVGTIVYDVSIDKTTLVDAQTGYNYAHCMQDNVLLLSNGSTNTLFDLTAETLVSKVSNYNYMLDTFLDLPSGDCLLGGDSFSNRLYIYRTNTRTIGELYMGGKRWTLMSKFNSGIALAGNASLAGIVKYDDNTKELKFVEIPDISGVTNIIIVNEKYALIRGSDKYFRYCVEDDSLLEVDSDTNSIFLMSVSISENELLLTGKQAYCGLFLYDAEENTLRTLYNPNYEYAVYSKYEMYDNGNILFSDSQGNYKVVYIAHTKTAELYNKNIDYNTYTGENNE